MRNAATVSLLAGLVLAGCYDSSAISLGSGGYLVDGGVPANDAGTCTGPRRSRPVDLLLVVDDSPSMVEEQGLLAAALPHFVTTLATGDRDGDGRRDFEPVYDLHAGVITVNMGVGGTPNVPTCQASPDFGDDGVLLDASRAGGAGCAATYPRVQSLSGGASGAMELGAGLACVSRTGTGGCGFEQQLDAMLKAVTSRGSPTSFFADSHGHADDPATNGGFLRPGSLLVIVMVTDEDDCSTDQTDLWNPASATHTGDLNLRCIRYADQLYPVSRFADGLRALGSDVLFLALTGVPEDLLAPLPGTVTVDYDRIFADPRMTPTVVDSGGTLVLQPACSATGRGSASPAVRIAHLAADLGPSALLGSSCAADYGPALDGLVALVAPRAVVPSCPAP